MYDAAALTVALKVDMKAASSPAITSPRTPGRQVLLQDHRHHLLRIAPAPAQRPVSANRAIPMHIAQRTTRNPLQAAPSFAASRGSRAARKRLEVGHLPRPAQVQQQPLDHPHDHQRTEQLVARVRRRAAAPASLQPPAGRQRRPVRPAAPRPASRA